MKVLLHSLWPCPPVGRWRRFEEIVQQCVRDLGHEVVEMPLERGAWPDCNGADFHIIAHSSRHQVPAADLFYKEMYMPGLFTIDSCGWGTDHSALRSAPDLSSVVPARAAAFCKELAREFLRTGQSKQSQPPPRPIAAALKPYLLAPTQIPTDDAIRFQSRIGVADFVNLLADWAEHARHNIVFKLHPGMETPEIATLVERRVAAGRYLFVANENIHALISGAEGTVVLTSGVGFESLIHGKPVVTLGQPDYRWACFQASPGDLQAALEWVRSCSARKQQATYSFAWFYYHEHAYRTDEAHLERSTTRLLNYLREAIARKAIVNRVHGSRPLFHEDDLASRDVAN